jgi:hypothetical protein
MPLYFIPNHGQVDSRVAYYLQGKDKTIYFTSEGLTYVLSGRTEGEIAEKTASGKERLLKNPADRELRSGRDQSRFAVKLDFVGANADVRPSGEEKTGAVISYFKGKPEEWKAGLPTYSRIVYKNLWPGIDVAYYGTVDKMKYEFVVHPGSDPSLIRLAYRGASAVEVNGEGRLEVRTPGGGFADDRPVGYQEINGDRVDVALRYLLEEPSATKLGSSGAAAAGKSYVYGFEVGTYDRTKPLVLDPAVLVYCGYIGGSGDDMGLGIAVDGSGNAYVTGYTTSAQATFPSVGGPDLTFNGNMDVFVAKVNASGTALVYCGYIGGSGDEKGNCIAVDGSGNAYITGDTSSNQATFPVAGGPDLTYNGSVDAFVAKVNASGTALVYCGYIGGSGDDSGVGIAVDGSGNAYVAGYTGSTQATFPVIGGPDLTFNGGADAFVAKVNASGTALVYCGYIGGSGDDYGYGIAVDGSGIAYVTGETNSNQATFPVVGGPDLTYNGGDDAFVAKVNASGAALVYCGYIGGSGIDICGGPIAVDGSGNAYVAGYTTSTQTTFPVIGGPDLTYNGSVDAFVAKVNASGTALVYCGYIGGSGDDSGVGIAVDGSGNAYVAGYTGSTQATFPVIGGPDLTYNGGSYDAFVAKVNASGAALVYCGYIGGSDYDEGYGIAVDGSGNAYVTGTTRFTQATFPVVGGPDLTYNGGDDAFVAKVFCNQSSPTVTTTAVSNIALSTATSGGNITSDGGAAVTARGVCWSTSANPTTAENKTIDGSGSGVYTSSITGLISSTTYHVRAYATNTLGTSYGNDLTFSTSASTITISGTVTAGGTALKDVILVGLPGNPVTNANGQYTAIIGSGWSGTVTPSLAGYAFVPASRTYSNIVAPQTNQDYAATTGFFMVSGTLTDGINPMPGISITFSHNGHYEITDANGYYAYAVPAGTTTIVKPVGSGPWSPAFRKIGDIASSRSNQDFRSTGTTWGLLNPSVEDGSGVPYYWTTVGNTLSQSTGWATGTAHSGTRSLKIENPSGTAAWWQGGTVGLPAPLSKALVVGGWSKAENVVSNLHYGLSFYLEFDDGSSGEYSEGLRFDPGTHGWQNVETTLISVKGIKSIRPYGRLESTTGAAWFDDFYAYIIDGSLGFLSSGSWTGAGKAGAGWFIGDFDGDGKKDIFRYYPGVSGADMFLSDGTQFNSVGSWTGAGYGSDGWYIGDFNGDGKADIFRYYPGVSGADMFLSDGTQFNSVGSWTGAGYGSDGWYVGDFNGDGKDDIMRYLAGVASEVFLSDGTQFVSAGIWTLETNGTDGWYVGDFNGDGKDDIMRYVPGVGSEVFLSDGTQFVSAGIWTGAGNGTDGWYVGDFNGDGMDDIFRYYPGVSGADMFLAGSVSGSVSEFDAFKRNASSSVRTPLDTAYRMEEKWLEPFRQKAARSDLVSLMDLKQAYENATGEKPTRAVLLRWLKRHDFRLISKE